MSWNIKTPGDYINGPLTVNGTTKIGATGTSYKLLVNTAVSNGGDIQLKRGGFIGFSNAADTSNSEYIFANGGALEFGINGSTLAILTGAGLFGLNTTGPVSLFDVRNGYITTGTGTATSGPKLLGGFYSDGHLTTLGSEQANGGPVLSYGVWPSTSAMGSFISSTGINVARGSYTIRGNQHIWFGSTGASVTTVGSSVALNQNMILDGAGNLIVGLASANANGGCLQLKSGITLPATQVASTDANTLDDYEEGAFTPIIQGSTSSGTATYAANGQNGYYTKVGRLVTVQMYIVWSGHTGTGAMRIGSLPFTALNVTSGYSSAAFGLVDGIGLNAGSILTGFTELNTNYINLYQYPSGGGSASPVALDTAGGLLCTLSYLAA